MADFIDYIALLLRALGHMPGLQMMILGIGAFLMGIALARVTRRLRIHPGRRALRVLAPRRTGSDHRHAAIHMHRGSGQIARLR